MKKVSILILVTLITSLLYTSCGKNELDHSLTRKILLQESSKDKLLEKYNSLSYSDKMKIWEEKLLQSIENSPKEYNEHIHSIINKIKSTSSAQELINSDDFRDLTMKTAENIAPSTFTDIFFSLNDLHFDNSGVIESKSEESRDLINYLKQSFEKARNTKPSSTQNKSAEKPCNCNWTCGDSASECTHSDCEATDTGCGFLWLFSCEQRDEIFYINCP